MTRSKNIMNFEKRNNDDGTASEIRELIIIYIYIFSVFDEGVPCKSHRIHT